MIELNIKTIRTSKNLTQKQLAAKVKISQSYLSKLECNVPNAINGVSLGVIDSIAKALNVPINYIIRE